jgi:hypothetical protein
MAKRKLKYDNLDKVFSIYIRLRDADDDGFCTCCSSGKRQHWKDMDCGHFISRRHLATRWEDMNCHAQSRGDNRFNQGNALGYSRFLLKKYGPNALDDLERMKNRPFKITQFEINNMVKYYREKIQELKKQKGL